MKNVLVGLLGVVLLLVIFSTQDAEAANVICDTSAVGVSLPADQMYIGDEDGFLWKLDVQDPDKGHKCKFAIEMKEESSGKVLTCFDLALHPTNEKLYCIFDGLYTINRGEPHKSPDRIGLLMDGIVTIKTMNALEFDHGGNLYAARNNAPADNIQCDSTAGSFYDVDITSGALIFRGNLGGRSSGDLIYDHIGDLVNGQMLWTSECCPGCTAGSDGLYKIDLTVFPNVGTFIADLKHADVFAGDMLTTGALCFVTNSGTLFESDLFGNLMLMEIATGIKAFGGTGQQILVGGVEVLIETTSLLLAGIEAIAIWITSALLASIGIAAFMLIGNNSNHRKQNY